MARSRAPKVPNWTAAREPGSETEGEAGETPMPPDAPYPGVDSEPSASGPSPPASGADAPMTRQQEREWGIWLHLSAFSGLFVPGGNLVGPLVMWLLRKDRSAFVDQHGKAALNFWLSMLVYGVGMAIVVFATLGRGLLLAWVFLAAAFAVGLLFPILACIKAHQGEPYRYPIAMTLLR